MLIIINIFTFDGFPNEDTGVDMTFQSNVLDPEFFKFAYFRDDIWTRFYLRYRTTEKVDISIPTSSDQGNKKIKPTYNRHHISGPFMNHSKIKNYDNKNEKLNEEFTFIDPLPLGTQQQSLCITQRIAERTLWLNLLYLIISLSIFFLFLSLIFELFLFFKRICSCYSERKNSKKLSDKWDVEAELADLPSERAMNQHNREQNSPISLTNSSPIGSQGINVENMNNSPGPLLPHQNQQPNLQNVVNKKENNRSENLLRTDHTNIQKEIQLPNRNPNPIRPRNPMPFPTEVDDFLQDDRPHIKQYYKKYNQVNQNDQEQGQTRLLGHGDHHNNYQPEHQGHAYFNCQNQRNSTSSNSSWREGERMPMGMAN